MIWLVVTAVLVTASVIVSIGGLILVRRSARFTRYVRDNEVAGLLFAAAGVVYGALLAFVVFAEFDSYSGAEAAVTTEGAYVIAAYRDTQEFPPPIREQTQAALRTYVTSVMASEWASHGNLVIHTTPDLLNPIWDLYRQVQPSGALSESEYTSATERLHQLEIQRHLRHLSGESTLPDVFWPVLIGGAVVLVLYSYFFYQEHLAPQALLTGLLAGLLMGVLVLIYSLNQPFTGPVPVSQQPLKHALAQFAALDLQPPP